MTSSQQKIILYILFGGIATLINIAIYTLLRTTVHSPIPVAYFIAWLAAVVYAFWSNRKTIFESEATTFHQITMEFAKFASSRIITGFFGWLILTLGILLYPNDLLWNVFQNTIVIIANYAISKYLVFSHAPI